MNEKMMKVMKRSLALALALILVIGAGSWMKDARLKADEEAPDREVVVEEAEAPAPVPAEEPVVAVQEVELPAEEPVAEEPAAEPTTEPTPEPAPEPTEEPVAEEPVAEEVIEEKAPFDVREAYEHYISLGSEAEKQAYLDSLDPADREELERYIAEQEPVIEAAGEEPVLQAAALSPETVEEAVEEAEAEAEAEEEPKAEEPAEEEKAPFDVLAAYEHYMCLGSDDEKAAYLESLDPADRAELESCIAEKELKEEEPEEPEKEPEEEAVPGTFGSAMISGEWAGRDTSTTRSFSIEVYVDGELADSCSGEANKSVANFSVAIGDCTVASVNSSCGGFTGSNGTYAIDMYADTFATVTIMLEAPEAEEEPVEEGSEEFDPAKVYEAALAMTEEEREAYAATLTAEEYEAVLAYAKSLEAEKEKFDSEAAYKEVMALPEEEREAYVMALSEEDYKALEEYALNLMEKKSKAVHYDIAVSVNYEGELGYGTVVTLTGDVLGFDDDESLDFVWEESADGGKTWTLIPGATGLSYSFTVTPENANNTWRISIA